jgi:uncharacterized protein
LRLIIFTRYPTAGRVKTRLISALGERGAMLLYRRLVEYTLDQSRNFEGSIEIRFTGGNLKQMKSWLGEQFYYREQKGMSLGERLTGAVAEAFSEEFKKVVVIGTDCPGLKIDHIDEAFRLLDGSELVIGPAVDGGYYLIGFSNYYPELFHDISWGSSEVYRQTIKAANRLNLKIAVLEKLDDIDRPADLASWLNLSW